MIVTATEGMMLINRPMTLEAWRKLLESLKAASSATYVPEYSEDTDKSLNKQYYL
jgi:hypothetical protein